MWFRGWEEKEQVRESEKGSRRRGKDFSHCNIISKKGKRGEGEKEEKSEVSRRVSCFFFLSFLLAVAASLEVFCIALAAVARERRGKKGARLD